RLFVNALKIVVLPLILASVVVGIAALGNLRKVGRIGWQVVTYFVATSSIAVVIGLVLAKVFGPGSTLTPGTMETSYSTISGILGNLLPESILSAMSQGNYLGLVVFSLFLGGVISAMGTKGKTVLSFFKELSEAVMSLVTVLLYAAPIGILSLVGAAVARNEVMLADYANLGLIVVAGLLLHAVVVLPATLMVFGQQSPFRLISAMGPAFLTAFGTASSIATLPVTQSCVVDDAEVDSRAGAFVLPLGASINMNGTALYVAAVTVLLAEMFGPSLSIVQLVLVGLTSLVISVGAAGMPMASLLLLPVALGVVGFSPERAVGIAAAVQGIDWLFDRLRTVVNVWGDGVVAAIAGESYEFKTARRTGVAPRRAPSRARSTATTSRPRTARPSTRSGSDRPPHDRRPAPRGAQDGGDSTDQRGRGRSTSRTRPGSGDRAPVKSSAPSPFEISTSGGPVLQEVDHSGDVARGQAPDKPPSELTRPDSSDRDRSRRNGRPSSRPSSPRSRSTSEQRPRRRDGRDESSDRPARQERTPERPARTERPPERPLRTDRPAERDARTERPAERAPRPDKPTDRPVPEDAAPERSVPVRAREDAAPRVRESRESVEPTRDDDVNGRLNPQTIARELARVSDQLQRHASGSLEQSESTRPEKQDHVPEDSAPEPPAVVERMDRFQRSAEEPVDTAAETRPEQG
ncbi:MAG: cation:dicarboxylase symporter family transporter, partial [candidate division Zixibacteria bacterium]|nr:cation:dicarboxylase symporter family transporter [candidate division Zixibacteria bacterium]